MTDDLDPALSEHAKIVGEATMTATVEAVPDPLPHIDIEAMVEDLEIGELKLLEEATGLKLALILRQFETNEFGADLIAAVVWISPRRDDPEATIEDADRIKLSQIAEVDDPDDDDDDEVPDP